MLTFASSTKSDGNMSFNWGNQAEVNNNRLVFLQKYDVDLNNGVLMNTVDHSDRLLVVDRANKGMGVTDVGQAPRVDALITTAKNLPLFLLTADCYPTLLRDKDETIIALVHLGWRGVDEHLVQKVVRQMAQLVEIKPQDILVKLGPGAGSESYIVESPSQLSNLAWQPYIKHAKGDNYKIDLPSFIRQQCLEVGLLVDNIELSAIDTIQDLNQFSHYRAARNGEPEGRFLTVASL